MPAVRKSRHSVEEGVRAELLQIRAQVAGVRGSLVATSDGLVVAHDIPDVEPTQIAALAAATLAVARRATLATECGTFREAVARGSDGYLAVYAAGDSTSGPNHWASGPAGPAGSAGSGTHTPAWIRRPTHSIASYSARPQVQARSWAERAPSIAHATAHCSRLSTAETAPRSRSRTGVVRANLKRAIRSAFLITSASTKSTHKLENAPAQCPLAHCVPGAVKLMSETKASRSAEIGRAHV